MNTPHSNQEDEIDLIALLASLYQKKRFIFKTVIGFMIIGLFVALVSPTIYKAQAIFVVQNSDKQVSSSISGLAALAGVNLQSEAMGDIPPSLYPNIVSGIPFKLDLLNTELEPNQLNYKDYLLNKPNSFGATIKKYTIGLPSLILSTILSTLKGDQEVEVLKNKEIFQLSEIDFELTESLEELISVEVNQKEGFITLSTLDQNPKYAAVMTSKALALLQNFITNYKTENANRILTFVTQQFELKQKQYNAVQKELAEFKDQNKNISTAVFQSNLQKIQTRYDLVYSVYLELSKQLEQAKLQVSKEIPNITIIEPVYIPNQREQPKRALILVVFSFLGLVVSCGWVLVSKPILEISKQIKA